MFELVLFQLNALKFIKKNGPIKKEDPNRVRGQANSKKRKAFELSCLPEGIIVVK